MTSERRIWGFLAVLVGVYVLTAAVTFLFLPSGGSIVIAL